VQDEITAADLDRNGRVDGRYVEILEKRHVASLANCPSACGRSKVGNELLRRAVSIDITPGQRRSQNRLCLVSVGGERVGLVQLAT
jgi:hypothetical protein